MGFDHRTTRISPTGKWGGTFSCPHVFRSLGRQDTPMVRRERSTHRAKTFRQWGAASFPLENRIPTMHDDRLHHRAQCASCRPQGPATGKQKSEKLKVDDQLHNTPKGKQTIISRHRRRKPAEATGLEIRNVDDQLPNTQEGSRHRCVADATVRGQPSPKGQGNCDLAVRRGCPAAVSLLRSGCPGGGGGWRGAAGRKLGNGVQ